MLGGGRIWTINDEHLVVISIVPKFGWNRCSNFDNMQVSIFCVLGLKKPIRTSKYGFQGI